MFESRISSGATEKLPCSENLSISSWSYDMEGHAKKCVERYCELANKTTQQLNKVSTPCLDDHHFKEEELKSVGELSKVCSQIVLKCLYLARIGRPGIPWSGNKFARSITKWTRACDKRLSRLIPYIQVNTNNIADWDCFKTEVRNKSEVIDEARTKGRKVHFASLMDICHVKNAELETKHQKYKGRVVLQGVIVKDDSGSYAVFTEQGSSASQMTAAKVMDIISRLPGCAGQTADAVSAYTLVKMEDAPKLLKT